MMFCGLVGCWFTVAKAQELWSKVSPSRSFSLIRCQQLPCVHTCFSNTFRLLLLLQSNCLHKYHYLKPLSPSDGQLIHTDSRCLLHLTFLQIKQDTFLHIFVLLSVVWTVRKLRKSEEFREKTRTFRKHQLWTGGSQRTRAEREGHGYSTPSLHRITAGQGEDGGEGRLEYEQNSKKENQTWEEAKAKEPR